MPAASTSTAVSATGRGGNLRDWARAAYAAVREETERRVAPLSDEDQLIQSMADASPAKWHRAHTTWFFEQFLLVPQVPGYEPFDERFAFLFNSYYVSAGPRHERPRRGLITRPTVAEVGRYRAHVDAAMARLLAEADEATLDAIAPVIEIGLNHEQQHQELMLTDILHGFAHNPTDPVYAAAWRLPAPVGGDAVKVPGGIYRIGHEGQGFSFDNEAPNHQVLIHPVAIGPLITNGEWLAFMQAGGYRDPLLWLSDGWATVQREGWDAPGYWRQVDGRWFQMTLAGMQPIDPAAAVCHVSYYEADAYARFAGKDLPTEQEWEVAVAGGLPDAFGIVWQWTRSAYGAYPGYRPVPGALGEYNGKFMVNQLVLRGSSVATPDGHERLTYRNFFYPHHRWQFTGLRLTEYARAASGRDGATAGEVSA
ncbi:ergothioneine biosynthesis protein EgtB [Chelatococcus reniformis]|uniref:Ergothioneine biosynthesis protein EgtB n=1 Tax=Chelatococcus reniformis TaxID=1494448 RepID=A0A916U7K5_9HYPH|nr:ergothioneine biosynthesis protein EgtB [Chelatococcus reniformis]GGC63546.1 ergothioneine biosynthesis protein EgtB [Chelatococcus reniformis]